MATGTIAVSVEATPKKAFATAVDWPGWSRSGKTEELAVAALADYAPRYAVVAEEAGVPFEPGDYEVVERTGGGGRHRLRRPVLDHGPRPPAGGRRGGRAPGTPRRGGMDRLRPRRRWAPAELRKGPRGGGRDRDKMVGHVAESDTYYAREIGITGKRPDPTDRPAIEAMRAEMLDILRRPSDGSALAGRTWTARYAARRIAWHALDHAWEMEDRSDPA